MRVSGDLALSIAKKITKQNNFTPRYANLHKLYFKDGQIIDEAIVIYFKSPKSFTGEDIVEFQSHGGIAIANIILEECINNGARIANGGEFSKRALLNNKMPIEKIETIAKMIESKNKKSIQILTKNLSGHLQNFLNEIRQSLVLLLAHSEVSIDYGEEDLPSNLISDISNKIDEIIHKFNQVLKNTSYSKKIIEGNSISIIGKPNVGKSSLLNTILGTNRAIISPTAGTTRDTIEELIEIKNHLVKIIDTAGIRDTNNDIESIGIEKSLESIKKADTILALFDISKPLDEDDFKVLNAIKDKNKQSIIILNKQDLGKNINIKEFENFPHQVTISAKNKEIDNLINSLVKILNQNTLTNDLSLSSKRQEDLIEKTKENLLLAKENIKNEDLEIFSYNITESLELISQVTSNYDYSELLDTMFEGFCLGK